MKINYINGARPPERSIAQRDIPVGTVFSAKRGGYQGPFLKTFDSVVSLAQPHFTWTDSAGTCTWEDYRPLEAEVNVLGAKP